MSITEAASDSEFPPSARLMAKIHLTHQRKVTVESAPKLPNHSEVLQVLPAVTGAHVAATRFAEAAVADHRHGDTILPRDERTVARDLHRARRVPRTAAIQVRRQQRVH